jgi:hypothetical protein
MAAYAVFEPPIKDPSRPVDLYAHAERFRFVRDGFSWGAFIFGPLWMLRHKLWLAFVVYMLIAGAGTFAAMRLGLAEGAVTLASILLALLVGFEGATLRRRKLLRKRWHDLGIVVARNREGAERRFFDQWTMRAPVASAPVSVAAAAPAAEPQASAVVLTMLPQDRLPSDKPSGDRP